MMFWFRDLLFVTFFFLASGVCSFLLGPRWGESRGGGRG